MVEERDESLRRLVERWKSGIDTEESFAALFRRFYRRVLNTLPGSRISPEIRKELTQEVFFTVYQYRASCRPSEFEGWLFRVARTTFLKWIEREGRLKRSGRETSLDDLAAMDSGSEATLDRLLDEERSGALRRVVEELPDRMRQCILLQINQGMNEAEIAATLRIAEGTVKAHLFAARKRLREKLSQEAPAGARRRSAR